MNDSNPASKKFPNVAQFSDDSDDQLTSFLPPFHKERLKAHRNQIGAPKEEMSELRITQQRINLQNRGYRLIGRGDL